MTAEAPAVAGPTKRRWVRFAATLSSKVSSAAVVPRARFVTGEEGLNSVVVSLPLTSQMGSGWVGSFSRKRPGVGLKATGLFRS